MGDIVDRLTSELTPDNIRQMKAVGLGELAEAIFAELERMARMVPRPINTRVQARLNELQNALREE